VAEWPATASLIMDAQHLDQVETAAVELVDKKATLQE
jgi:hypothetical protein